MGPGLNNDHRSAALDEREGHFKMRLPLRAVVLGQETLSRGHAVALIYKHPVRIAEDRQGAGVDDPGNAELVGHGEHIPGAFDIDPLDLFLIPRPQLVPGGDMEDNIAALHPRPEGLEIVQVALNEGHPHPVQFGGAVCGAGQRPHLIASLQQFSDEGSTDKTSTARDKCAHKLLPWI
jgi:hypothetical protein